MPAFLSNEWFDKVDSLTAEAGDLNLSPALAGMALNMTVTEAGKEDVNLSLDGGKIQKGLSSN
ncbi:SCP-2 sterol transfer family protein, partial [Rhizobium hidalgonense]|nr:SCP-2 sterol transfer family protein [Rhizobium hidalgonense]